MAHNYTKEAGVRQLERKIGAVCRKAAKELLMTEKEKIAVTDRNLSRFLGKEKYTYQMANAAPEVGIVRGLAWTSVGGDTLQIEVNVMPGKGEIMLTGKLGDVMKESARTGISYIRSVSKKYAIQEDFFEKHDIHVHIPEGAVPKDGPSAGITMATAILSAVTGKKVRADLAMTPDCFLLGMEIFEATPENSYVFEDSFHGLQAGMTSGATVIGLATTNSREAITGKAHYIIDDFTGMTYEKMISLHK